MRFSILCRSTWAAYFVNLFNKFGRTWQVTIYGRTRNFAPGADFLKQL